MALALVAVPSVVLAATEPVKTEPVAALSAEKPRESRRSSELSPTSSLSVPMGTLAALVAAATVPKTKVFTVQPTGSMRPLFDEHAILLVEAAPFEDLKIGDIVLFDDARRGITIVHRIIQQKGDGFWTKGDHNGRMDDILVTRKNYQGRLYGIVYASRGGGAGGAQSGTLAASPAPVPAQAAEPAPVSANADK